MATAVDKAEDLAFLTVQAQGYVEDAERHKTEESYRRALQGLTDVKMACRSLRASTLRKLNAAASREEVGS